MELPWSPTGEAAARQRGTGQRLCGRHLVEERRFRVGGSDEESA